jgi:hypothetical protein
MCFDGNFYALLLRHLNVSFLCCFYEILSEKSLLNAVTGQFFSMTTSQWMLYSAFFCRDSQSFFLTRISMHGIS